MKTKRKTKKYRRRYFKNTKQVKTFAATLFFDWLNQRLEETDGKIDDAMFTKALSFINTIVKCTTQEHYERLGALPSQLEELKARFEDERGGRGYYKSRLEELECLDMTATLPS